MTKQEILEYILKTPENTNPTILEQLLDELGGGGGGQLPDNVWAQSMIDEYGIQWINLKSHRDKTIIVGGIGITTKTKAKWVDLLNNHDKYECTLVVNSLDVIKTYPLIWNENDFAWASNDDGAATWIQYDRTTTELTIEAEYMLLEGATEEQIINTTLQVVINEK